jgi:VanZ family protein
LRTAAYASRWRYWAPPVIWALAIVALSGNFGSFPNTFGVFKWVISWIVTMNPDTLATVHFYFRKVLHVVCYGVLTVLWFRALMASFPDYLWSNRILALVLCLMVSLADEGRQYFYPARSSSWWDIGLDLSGGIILLFLATRYFNKNRVTPPEEQPVSP